MIMPTYIIAKLRENRSLIVTCYCYCFHVLCATILNNGCWALTGIKRMSEMSPPRLILATDILADLSKHGTGKSSILHCIHQHETL